ncbi:MAG: VWA domain-containing protein [Bryobacteraceae bacterium]|nr:VWA domain-containing protein [Bryobacteraceae bacterium]
MGCIHKYAMVKLVNLRIPLLLALAALALNAQAPPKPAAPAPPVEEDQVIKIDVDLVNIYFNVRDKRGAYAGGLKAEDFDIYEDGKKQEPRFFTRETNQPLTLGLLIDVSRSQENLIEVEKRASSTFFAKVLKPKDMAFIISFGSDADLLQDLTGSLSLLERGLRELRISGGVSGVVTPSTVPTPGGPRGTVLYDAVWLAARDRLQNEVGRKAIVLITDGVDVGSRVKIEEAIQAAHKSDAIIFPILYEDPRYTSAMFGGYSGEGAMKRMGNETGGRIFRVDRRNSLDDIYKQIEEDMRTQYAIGYSSSNPNRDGAFRRVEIRPKNKDLKIQARRGYYAPKD